jgi:hypothetical protein
MAFETSLLGFVLGLLLAIVFIRYSGYLPHVKKAVGFIAGGVMFYIIDLAWTMTAFASKIPSDILAWLSFVWQLVAFILIIIGGIWAAVELVSKS